MVSVKELVALSSRPALAVDAAQRVVAINLAAEELLGYHRDEALAMTCDRLLQGVEPDGAKLCSKNCKTIAGFMQCRPYASPKCFLRRKDGSRLHADLSSIAVRRPDGDTGGDAADGAIALIFIADGEQSTRNEPADDKLHIHTLGRFSISLHGCCLALEHWPRKQAVQLLKFLVVNVGRPIHRERLAEHLWPDADEQTGWSRLKVTISFLRQRLREAGHNEIIKTTDASYLLRSDSVWIDHLAFEEFIRKGRAHQSAGEIADAIHCFEEARQLYRGDFMEADVYADWCAEDRERLFELYVETLNTLAELHYDVGEFAVAAQECHAALVREPCRERVHRLLIRSLIALQRPDSALRQYGQCERILKTELGVPPAAETMAVISSLLKARGGGSSAHTLR